MTASSGSVPHALGDFTANRRLLPISVLAIAIGAASAVLALLLLHLIGFFTNLFFYQRWSTALDTSPTGHALGLWVVFVPVAGALVVGLMARYGSERIRGHGIPEALEAILINGSRVQPRVALLKPVSAAVSIGSGGPFGAEGPIIMTGGAFGSMIAQLFRLSSAERKTLLVAGAAAGMSATFSAPIASVLMAVELLLFELKPRSLVPVALASATAMLLRHFLLGPGPLFPVPPHAAFVGLSGLAGCALVGLLAGALSALMTLSVYAAEDLFQKLPIHWMWWPAIGAVFVGLGGLLYPGALGVGYDRIFALLNGQLPIKEILLLVAVKWAIWSIFLGSGTSGGVLAPLLMIGAALGGLLGGLLPFEGVGFWPLIAMGAILGGTMRSPLTGIIFAVELTGDGTALLPLLVAATVAHGFTVLTLRRSILTEKVARRGYHLTREYQIDPLEVLFVRDVMSRNVVALPASSSAESIQETLSAKLTGKIQLFPVVDEGGKLQGVVSREELSNWAKEPSRGPLAQAGSTTAITARPDELLLAVVQRMAETGRTRLPVIQGDDIVGLVTLTNLLKARQRHMEEERRREVVLPIHVLIPTRLRSLLRRSA